MLNLDFRPEATPRQVNTESASHHVVGTHGTPHNTAHMRQHGKLEISGAWNLDFPRFAVKSDDLQIFINSIILNENINQKLFLALIF